MWVAPEIILVENIQGKSGEIPRWFRVNDAQPENLRYNGDPGLAMIASADISGNSSGTPSKHPAFPQVLYETLRKNLYPAIFLILLIAILYEVSRYNFALFHTAIEFSTITIAVAIFLLVWKSRHLVQNNYLLFIGVTFVFIAILDFLHTTVYQGVGIFADGGGTLSTRLWIAARYMQAVTLFAAPLLMRKKTRIDLVAVVYLAADIIIVASIFIFKNFPVTYIEGVGLTPFKIFSEYIISLLLVGAVVLLYRNRASFDRQVLDNLVIAIIFMILSELAFTEYASFVDIFSIIGHVFRLVAYYFYRAIIEVGQEKPYNLLYRDLNESEKKYRALSDLSPDAILVIQDGIIRYANNAGLHLSGVPDMEHLIDRDLGDFMHPDDRTQSASRLAAAQDEQVIAPLRELRIIVNGVTIPVEATGGPFLWEGKPATQFVIRDISARKNAEKALAELDRDRKIILDNMPVMIWYKDTRNNFIRVNAAVAKNTGHAVEEFEGKHAAELFPEEADAYYRDDLEVIRSGAPRYRIIEQMAAPDGKKLWVQTDKIPLKDEVGTVTGILVISIDITERKNRKKRCGGAKNWPGHARRSWQRLWIRYRRPSGLPMTRMQCISPAMPIPMNGSTSPREASPPSPHPKEYDPRHSGSSKTAGNCDPMRCRFSSLLGVLCFAISNLTLSTLMVPYAMCWGMPRHYATRRET